MTKIKLWISDIDGTLVDYDGYCSDKMKETIKKVNESDTKLILATGRMFMGADFACSKFNLKNPVVCYQGAVVRTKEEVLWQSLIDNNIVREIINFLRERKIHTHVYNNDILYVEDDNKKIMNAYCEGRGTTYEVCNFDKIELQNVPKLLGVIEDKNLMNEIKQELIEKYGSILTIVQSSPIYLEINDKNASKGSALNFLKEYYNLNTDETLATGDQDNDIEMLKCAGIKISVGNNSKELLKIADYNCKDVRSDELCGLIDKIILNN